MDSSQPSADSCPNCAAPVVDPEECSGCGLLLARYHRNQRKKTARAEADAQRRQRRRYLSRLTLVFAAIMLLYCGAISALVLKPEAALTVIAWTGRQVWDYFSSDRSRMYNPGDKSFIDRARQATVHIRTPDGSGSGFFITPTKVLTNKHVVDYDLEGFEDYRRKLEREIRIIELEGEKLEELRRRYRKLPPGPSREQLALIIEAREENYRLALDHQKRLRTKLADIASRQHAPTITVYRYDGTELPHGFIQPSRNFDLALIDLPAADNPYLRPDSTDYQLQQGDAVYTVGSPKGLVNTVTAGIFSGYRRVSGQLAYLQVDAPINPGNSGGPLINQYGDVLGINTAEYRDSEGLGFAIPIKIALDEFETFLRP